MKTSIAFLAFIFLLSCGEKKSPAKTENNIEAADSLKAETQKINTDTSGIYASVVFFGTVLDYYSDKGIAGASIMAYNSADQLIAVAKTDANGKFMLDSLYTQYNYTIHFSKGDYIKKILYLQTDEIKPEADSALWPVDVTVSLFRHPEPEKFRFLENTPAAQLIYHPKRNEIVFDTAYALKIKQKIEKLLQPQ